MLWSFTSIKSLKIVEKAQIERRLQVSRVRCIKSKGKGLRFIEQIPEEPISLRPRRWEECECYGNDPELVIESGERVESLMR